MSNTFTETITLEKCQCASCGTVYAISEKLKESLRESHKTFYCPNGHSQWFPQDNEAERLRKELKRKEQELADRIAENYRVQAELDSTIKKQKKDLKRLTNGVCPCCNRTFSNLLQHMKKQHPESVIPSK